MLRTHRSLEAYCATLWWKWLVFFVFPYNGAQVEWNWQGKTDVTRGKTCPNATLSTTNPTWNDPGSNPGLRGERPATKRLSHGTAMAPVRSMSSGTWNLTLPLLSSFWRYLLSLKVFPVNGSIKFLRTVGSNLSNYHYRPQNPILPMREGGHVWSGAWDPLACYWLALLLPPLLLLLLLLLHRLQTSSGALCECFLGG
jgi:hypothetical protein